VTYGDAEPLIRAVTQDLLQEINKSLDFFRATAKTDHFDNLVLSGGCSRIEGLAEALCERFEADVQPFDPLDRVTVDPQVLSVEERVDLGPMLAVAVGLALRQVGDR